MFEAISLLILYPEINVYSKMRDTECTFKALIVCLLCCIHRVFLHETGGQPTETNSAEKNLTLPKHTVSEFGHNNKIHEKDIYYLKLVTNFGLKNITYRQQKKRGQFSPKNRIKRSTDIISSSKPQEAPSSTQRSDIYRVTVKSNINGVGGWKQSDEQNNAIKNGERSMSVKQEMNSSYHQQRNISTSINMTVLNMHEKSLRHRRDITSATLCLSAVLVLLIAVVLYSRMWVQKNRWRTLDEVLEEQDARSELPQHGKFVLRDLIESKISIIKAQLKKIPKRYQHSSKRGQYKELIRKEISKTEAIYS